MQGELTVTSEAGKGTTFRITLPPAPADVGRSTPPPARETTDVCRAKVLIVDDEPQVADVLARALCEHAVTIAASGRQALELFAAGQRYDVIFCDLMMPGMSGMELYEEVQRCWSEQTNRIVFVTGGASNDSSQSFLDRIANEHIDKPFTLTHVRGTVSRLARRSQMTESLSIKGL
jgi:DNA-binding response OmpR family regulator